MKIYQSNYIIHIIWKQTLKISLKLKNKYGLRNLEINNKIRILMEEVI